MAGDGKVARVVPDFEVFKSEVRAIHLVIIFSPVAYDLPLSDLPREWEGAVEGEDAVADGVEFGEVGVV